MPRLITTVAFPDLHLGHHDPAALRVALKLFDYFQADRALILGDWLDAHGFSSHKASDRRELQAATYLEEVRQCRKVLRCLEDMDATEIVYLEGNHEFRVERWAVSVGGPALELVDHVSPKTLLSQGALSRFSWVPYKDSDQPAHYVVAPGLIACHGWSTARHAAAAHIRRAGGLSVIHGHTHRAQSFSIRHPITGERIEGHSPGCLSQLQPLWVSGPTSWTQGVSVIQQRGERWSMFHVPIVNGAALTPSGDLITAGRAGSVVKGVA